MINAVSAKGEKFIFDKEGCPTRAYRDVGGVITIGPGFTMLSKAFSEYWLRTRGHKLRMGDTMSVAEARRVFPSVLNEEYGRAALAALKPKEQHHHDGATSVGYNAGTGSYGWQWGRALAEGRIADAARLLHSTAITAGGKVVNGLKKRREAEARLIENGDYGNASAKAGGSISSTVEEIKTYQRQLQTLGYYKGAIDGDAGKLTKGAVENFQRAEGLKVDGIVGPATRAALARRIAAKGQGTTALGGGLLSGGGGTFLQLDDPVTLLLIGGAVVVLLFVGFTLWNNRGVILRKRTPA